jgi:hypothetical protein
MNTWGYIDHRMQDLRRKFRQDRRTIRRYFPPTDYINRRRAYTDSINAEISTQLAAAAIATTTATVAAAVTKTKTNPKAIVAAGSNDVPQILRKGNERTNDVEIWDAIKAGTVHDTDDFNWRMLLARMRLPSSEQARWDKLLEWLLPCDPYGMVYMFDAEILPVSTSRGEPS